MRTLVINENQGDYLKIGPISSKLGDYFRNKTFFKQIFIIVSKLGTKLKKRS